MSTLLIKEKNKEIKKNVLIKSLFISLKLYGISFK